jgi:hypothetical protein
VDWKKRFESGRLGVSAINVPGKSRVIVGVGLPAAGGIMFLAIEMKMVLSTEIYRRLPTIESSHAFLGLTFYRSCDL